MAESNGRTKKILLGVGVGCGALVSLCCLSGGGAAWMVRSSIASTAEEHVGLFLGQVQSRDWEGAYRSATYSWSRDLHSPEAHQRCVEDTALGDLRAFECDGVDVDVLDGDADVHCTLQSTSRGEVEAVIHVNSADDEDTYLGFYWFESAAAFGPVWAGGSCSSWSGREYVYAPPDGMVRPGR